MAPLTLTLRVIHSEFSWHELVKEVVIPVRVRQQNPWTEPAWAMLM